MPFYNYKCPKCQKSKELMRKFSQMKDPVQCQCGSEMNFVAFPENYTSGFNFKGKSFNKDGEY